MGSSLPNRCCILCPQSLVASTFPLDRTGHMESLVTSTPSMRPSANQLWCKSASTTTGVSFRESIGNGMRVPVLHPASPDQVIFAARRRLKAHLIAWNQCPVFGSKRALTVANESRESSRSSGRSSKNTRLCYSQTPDPYCPTLETPPGWLLELLVNVKNLAFRQITGAEVLAEPQAAESGCTCLFLSA